MAYFEKHIQKYELFRKDAENETVSDPTRINAYFEAAFHLIEAIKKSCEKIIQEWSKKNLRN